MGTCWWVSRESEAYHALEWNVLVDDDTRFYEFLSLEILQAGLRWRLVMQRREAMRKALHGFNPERLATLRDESIQHIMEQPGMIRHAGKVRAILHNARVFLAQREQYGSFLAFITQTIGLDKPVEAYAPIFKDYAFFGSTMQREFLESSGIVSKEHDAQCFFHTLTQREAERIIQDREAVYGSRLVRHDATLRRRFPTLTSRRGTHA